MKRSSQFTLPFLSILMLLFAASADAQENIPDLLKSDEFSKQLNYPRSVYRFYQNRGLHSVWIKTETEAAHTFQAMLLLDCVLQFGLSHQDYHPKTLNYEDLQQMISTPEKVSGEAKAKFDILLTDAMISLINHLHYGKLNPDISAGKQDNGIKGQLQADIELSKLIGLKDMSEGIAKLEPQTEQYRTLKNYLRLVRGQYSGDCYQFPRAEARKAAINMERIRWAGFSSKNYIQVNIPSYLLSLVQDSDIHQFRIIVGKSETPTPVLQSVLNELTTTPDSKIPHNTFVKVLLPKALKNTRYFDDNHYTVYDLKGVRIPVNSVKLKEIAKNPGNYILRQSADMDSSLGLVVFRFPNDQGVYLHDSPEKELFNRSIRMLSPGCIRIENAVQLANLLLAKDGGKKSTGAFNTAITKNLQQKFMLKTPVAIKITYLTCEISEGMPVIYKDIYQQDRTLEEALFREKETNNYNN